MAIGEILDRLRGLPEIAGWPEALAYAERAVHQEGRSVWDYPAVACLAMGGQGEAALSGAAAVFCALTAIHLVDDLLDDDPHGEFRRLGAGRAANLALAFQAAAHLLLDEAAAGGADRAGLQACLARMALATARGQELDAREPVDEEAYWRVVGAKTPPLFTAALEIGALLCGAPPAAVAALGRLGTVMAHFVQVSDDLADALETPASADWRRGRGNLAILYAMNADHPERERFLALAARVDEPAALAEAQQILVRSGAVAYCVYRMTAFAQEARELLAAAPVPDRRPLERLLSRQREPLTRLLATVGADAVLDPAPSL